MINYYGFFKIVRDHYGPLKQYQVDGFDIILQEWERRQLTDLRHLAYMLATVWHETARTMMPLREFGKGKGRRYGKKDPETQQVYYGRGYVQLTWADNYKRMGEILDIPLYSQPELACSPPVAVAILFEGMFKGASQRGDFTGLALEHFFSDDKCDPIGARAIINGTDSAVKIASHYDVFLKALKSKLAVVT